MNGQDEEVARLRASVNCATILEHVGTGWRLDQSESTRKALKYRRGPGEILIVNHEGRGWFDPFTEAKGDIFDLVQRLDPDLNFGQVRQCLRKVAGIGFTYPESVNRPPRQTSTALPAERWAARRQLRRGSAVWRYLTEVRCLPETVLKAAAAVDAVREGPYASACARSRVSASLTLNPGTGPRARQARLCRPSAGPRAASCAAAPPSGAT